MAGPESGPKGGGDKEQGSEWDILSEDEFPQGESGDSLGDDTEEGMTEDQKEMVLYKTLEEVFDKWSWRDTLYFGKGTFYGHDEAPGDLTREEALETFKGLPDDEINSFDLRYGLVRELRMNYDSDFVKKVLGVDSFSLGQLTYEEMAELSDKLKAAYEEIELSDEDQELAKKILEGGYNPITRDSVFTDDISRVNTSLASASPEAKREARERISCLEEMKALYPGLSNDEESELASSIIGSPFSFESASHFEPIRKLRALVDGLRKSKNGEGEDEQKPSDDKEEPGEDEREPSESGEESGEDSIAERSRLKGLILAPELIEKVLAELGLDDKSSPSEVEGALQSKSIKELNELLDKVTDKSDAESDDESGSENGTENNPESDADSNAESGESGEKQETLERLRKMKFGEWFAYEYGGYGSEKWPADSFFTAPPDMQRDAMRKYAELFKESDAEKEKNREMAVKEMLDPSMIERTLNVMGLNPETETVASLEAKMKALSEDELTGLYRKVVLGRDDEPDDKSGDTSDADTGTGGDTSGADTGTGAESDTNKDTGAEPGPEADTESDNDSGEDSGAENGSGENGSGAENGSGENADESAEDDEARRAAEVDSALEAYSKEKLPRTREEILRRASLNLRFARMVHNQGEDVFVARILKGFEAWDSLSKEEQRALASKDGNTSGLGIDMDKMGDIMNLANYGYIPELGSL